MTIPEKKIYPRTGDKQTEQKLCNLYYRMTEKWSTVLPNLFFLWYNIRIKLKWLYLYKGAILKWMNLRLLL